MWKRIDIECHERENEQPKKAGGTTLWHQVYAQTVADATCGTHVVDKKKGLEAGRGRRDLSNPPTHSRYGCVSSCTLPNKEAKNDQA